MCEQAEDWTNIRALSPPKWCYELARDECEASYFRNGDSLKRCVLKPNGKCGGGSVSYACPVAGGDGVCSQVQGWTDIRALSAPMWCYQRSRAQCEASYFYPASTPNKLKRCVIKPNGKCGSDVQLYDCTDGDSAPETTSVAVCSLKPGWTDVRALSPPQWCYQRSRAQCETSYQTHRTDPNLVKRCVRKPNGRCGADSHFHDCSILG